MSTVGEVTGIVLMDLDRTLIDESYHITDDGIIAEVERMQSSGWVVGFNSDTPLISLRERARTLGMKGPLIGENGAMLEWGGVVPKQKLVNFDAAGARLELLKAWQSVHSDALVIVGDVVALVSSSPQFPDLSHHLALLINGLREASLAFYVRLLSHGRLTLSMPLLDEASELLEDAFAGPGCCIETDPDYGYATVRPTEASKDRGVARLREIVGKPMIYMVGDSAADIVEAPCVRLCAVGNADGELKRRAWFTARQHYTAGVIEILRVIQATRQ